MIIRCTSAHTYSFLTLSSLHTLSASCSLSPIFLVLSLVLSLEFSRHMSIICVYSPTFFALLPLFLEPRRRRRCYHDLSHAPTHARTPTHTDTKSHVPSIRSLIPSPCFTTCTCMSRSTCRLRRHLLIRNMTAATPTTTSVTRLPVILIMEVLKETTAQAAYLVLLR